MADPRGGRYRSKIIKAGALIADTKTLLANWDETGDVQDNLARAQRENVLGKASRSRVRDILAIFRQRYMTDADVLAGLVHLVKAGWGSESLDRVLYFLAASSDALLHDAVTEVLAPRVEAGRRDVETGDLRSWVLGKVAEGRTQEPWSARTIERVARGLLATLRDFGALEGAARKRIAPVFLPVPAFGFVAFLVYRNEGTGERLVKSPDWRLFFLTTQAVERLLIEAHQQRLLNYQAAGRVVRIEFGASGAGEYAHALVERMRTTAGE